MSCEKFEKYELGEIDFVEFERHARECSVCLEKIRVDERLMSLARPLAQKPILAPHLWSRIEESLKREKKNLHDAMPGARTVQRRIFRFKLLALIPAAAVLFVVAGLGVYLGLKALSGPSPSGLLADKALAKVEKSERRYMQAIAELEKKALPKMAGLDLEMMFLYRDKLETIETQIERCKDALAVNPANAHIRRYLLAALQDKKETLAELLSYEPRKSM